jgi:hypothetical protein
MKVAVKTLLLVLLVPALASFSQTEKEKVKIQIALLIDVSGSMGGLLFQVQSQIWCMVNDLNKINKGGTKPHIEFALISRKRR